MFTAETAAQPSPLPGLIDRARTQKLSITELFQAAEIFNAAGLKAEAVELYKAWIAFNDSNPLVHVVLFNYSVTLRQAGDLAGSIHALRACLHAEPKFGQAHVNLGRALEDAGLTGQAIQQWQVYLDQTADVTPDRFNHRLMVLEHTGRLLENAGMMEEAEKALWKAIELKPEKPESGQHWTSIRQRLCKWPMMQTSEQVTARHLIDSLSPLTLACHADDPVFQLAKAYRYCRNLVGRPDISAMPKPVVRPKTAKGEKLRIGYVSSDLRDHAVGFALSEVLELHDKAKVEIVAYYIGDPVQGDATQARMKASVDLWRDLGRLDDLTAARQIAADEIDILIDVNGFTKHARTRIFAYRPAPVIVNFCGYPGTMGSPFHHYIIGDPWTIPEGSEIYYTETVKRVACNQPVDRKRVIAARPERVSAGLPDGAFVFACFNGMQKITEAVFKRWMTILAATPGSVLWLLGASDDVNQRLRNSAQALGVAPDRLIFAPKAQNPHHLARIALADLFLDTFPYGAHSTAADALTMGLPVLTLPGRGFAARFCASIVAAAGGDDALIATDPEDYVRKAIALATDRKALKTLRDRIESGRDGSTLRAIPALVSRLETLYAEMQADAEAGRTPVPDLGNLDLYYEIGADIMKEGIEFLDEADYRARYRERLERWDAFTPIAPDRRLWPAG